MRKISSTLLLKIQYARGEGNGDLAMKCSKVCLKTYVGKFLNYPL
jgi:hypothetical protein